MLILPGRSSDRASRLLGGDDEDADGMWIEGLQHAMLYRVWGPRCQNVSYRNVHS